MVINDYDLPTSPCGFDVYLECIGSIAQACRDYTGCGFWEMQTLVDEMFYGGAFDTKATD